MQKKKIGRECILSENINDLLDFQKFIFISLFTSMTHAKYVMIRAVRYIDVSENIDLTQTSPIRYFC